MPAVVVVLDQVGVESQRVQCSALVAGLGILQGLVVLDFTSLLTTHVF